jgi:lysophospholipase L1-like esterase
VWAAIGCGEPPRQSGVFDLNEDGVIRVVVVGDSNSDPDFGYERRFCEALAVLRPQWDVICKRPYAHAGATVTLSPSPHAYTQTQAAMDEDPDAVVFALGTNDVRRGRSPELIVTTLRGIQEKLVGDRLVYVATIPYTRSGALAVEIDTTNGMLRNAFPWVIDHTTGFRTTDYSDEFHFTPAANEERARRALAVMDPQTPGAAGPAGAQTR